MRGAENSDCVRGCGPPVHGPGKPCVCEGGGGGGLLLGSSLRVSNAESNQGERSEGRERAKRGPERSKREKRAVSTRNIRDCLMPFCATIMPLQASIAAAGRSFKFLLMKYQLISESHCVLKPRRSRNHVSHDGLVTCRTARQAVP